MTLTNLTGFGVLLCRAWHKERQSDKWATAFMTHTSTPLYLLCFSGRGICSTLGGSEREVMSQYASTQCVDDSCESRKHVF